MIISSGRGHKQPLASPTPQVTLLVNRSPFAVLREAEVGVELSLAVNALVSVIGAVNRDPIRPDHVYCSSCFSERRLPPGCRFLWHSGISISRSRRAKRAKGRNVDGKVGGPFLPNPYQPGNRRCGNQRYGPETFENLRSLVAPGSLVQPTSPSREERTADCSVCEASLFL